MYIAAGSVVLASIAPSLTECKPLLHLLDG